MTRITAFVILLKARALDTLRDIHQNSYFWIYRFCGTYYSNTPIYRTPIYRKPRFTAHKTFLPNCLGWFSFGYIITLDPFLRGFQIG